jgi:putative tryptophan/tyrosine transport system substrate-binding protein
MLRARSGKTGLCSRHGPNQRCSRAGDNKPLYLDHPQFEGFDAALRTLVSQRVDVVIVLQTSMLLSERQQIAAWALANRLPTVFGYPLQVRSGGLVSYGVDLPWCFYRSAYFVDKILRGTAPGDLPVEFPSKMVLLVNLKTAKALGLTIPPTLLSRADEVIE